MTRHIVIGERRYLWLVKVAGVCCVQSADMRCDDGAIRPAVDASLLILVCLRAELEPASLGYDSSTRQKHCEGYLTAFFEWFNPTNPFQNTCALFLRFHGCYPGYSSLWSCCLTFVHRRGFGCPFSEHWYHSEATLSSSSSLPWEPSVVLCCQRFLMSTGLSSQYCSNSRLVRFPAALSLQPISIGMSTPPIAAH